MLKYLWLLNGASMSFLWTLLIRLLSETLSEKDILGRKLKCNVAKNVI